MTWLGLDIGGANLKAATVAGWAHSLPFALWRNPHGLAGALSTLVEGAPAVDQLAVTMTGELCDCFRTKTEGVHHILSAVEEFANGRDVSVYLVDGRLVTLSAARELPQLAAASNWRALAQFAGRFALHGRGLLIDAGSTTTDIIPLVDGQVVTRGTTDTERLASRELVYSGVGRTPVCAVTQALPWRGGACPVAAELFATTADAYVLLGEVAEDPHATWTADGRPLTIECARQRLARQLCADADDFADLDLIHVANAIRDAQLGQLASAVSAVIGEAEPPGVVISSGAGEFLAKSAAATSLQRWRTISLTERLGPVVSRCAPAYAVAVLAEEG
jgi:(4-(4-[2-(gamma-L-glutamylamino)ethyl]phenoxymethyl)furan-2-yl)methanamine synthase